MHSVNPGWPPASSGTTAPPGTEYIPTVKTPQKRQAPAHLQNKAARSSQIPGWSPTHVFTSEDAAIGLQKLFVIVEDHADFLDNLSVEVGCLDSSINMGSNEAYSNTRLLVNNLRDETARHFQNVQLEMTSLTPEAATLHLQGVLGGDIFTLRTELSKYNEELQVKLAELDTSCKTSLAALQVIANDAGTEIGALRSSTNEANTKIAAKFSEIEKKLENIQGPQSVPQAAPQVPERRPFIDPVTGKNEWQEVGPTGPEQFFVGSRPASSRTTHKRPCANLQDTVVTVSNRTTRRRRNRPSANLQEPSTSLRILRCSRRRSPP